MNVECKHIILRAKRSGVEKQPQWAPYRLFSTSFHFARTIESQKGQGLIEVLAALTIAMIVLSALSVAAITSLRNATFSKNQNQANAYARQTIDSLRAYRDLYKSHFFNDKVEGCYILSNDLVQSLVGGIPAPDPLTADPDSMTLPCTAARGEPLPGGFTRKIMLDKDGNFTIPAGCPSPLGNNSCVKLTAFVIWSDSSGTHQSEQSIVLGKWQ